MADVLLGNDDLTVFGPPEVVELLVVICLNMYLFILVSSFQLKDFYN